MTDRITAFTPRSELISMFAGYPEHMAVVNDDIAALDAALAADDGDCNVEHHGLDSDTPLMLAIRLHRTRIFERLLSVGASISVAQFRAVWVAAKFGNAHMMAILIQAGIDPRMRLHDKNTLCHYAAWNPDASVLRVLVAAGAPIDEWNNTRERPIHNAAHIKNEEVLSILLAAGCSVARTDIVATAAFNRNHKILAMLIKAGVDVKSMDRYCYYPIHHAAQNPNAAVVRLLIDAGVDVNVLAHAGESPLFRACENPIMEVLDALLAAGAEWCDVGSKRTVCHAVARNTNEAIVRRVIERGFDVNARSSDGWTPLMYAAQFGTAAVVSILLEAGADVHATDTFEKNACQRACWSKNAGIMRVLIDAGARFDVDVLKESIDKSNIDAVQALIDAGMNVANEINSDPSLLFVSTWRPRKPELLELLIRRGVDFRVVHKGQTLCHTANEGYLAVLFAHGADLNAKDSDGRTPIRVAYAGEIATLISTGIDISQRRHNDEERERWWLLAAGHPRGDFTVSRRQVAWACHRIAQRQFELLRLRAFQVCVGLEHRQLPALVSCEILAHAFAPLESLVAFHRVWAIVTKIKHFQRRGTH